MHVLVTGATGFVGSHCLDTIHVPAMQLRNPTWKVAFDSNAQRAVNTRKSVLTRAAHERSLIAGSHIPFPSFGHIRTADQAFEFEPVVWEW